MGGTRPIVLASASPRRRRMFEAMRIPFEAIPADIEERVQPGDDPASAVRRAALAKGRTVADRLVPDARDRWVVSADTEVVLKGAILGKPRDTESARRMLTLLSGQTHRVMTGWAIGRHGAEWIVDHEETRVTFHPLSDLEIDRYVRSGEGLDKAGAYGIQGLGAFLVARIEGDYFNVVGLPVSRVVRALLRVGALPAFPLL